jgi:penicillin-binding protein 2
MHWPDDRHTEIRIVTTDSPRLRIGVIGIVAVSLFAALFARLWYLQVMAAPQYQLAARANQSRLVVEPAPRGRILDRNGVVIVDNRLSIVVTIDRQVFADLPTEVQDAQLARLAEEFTLYVAPTTVQDLRDRLVDQRFSPYTPVPVVQDVPEELEIYLREHHEEFPGVRVEVRSVRSYPYGRLASHMLGYVGPINGDELNAKAASDKPYEQTDQIGKTGVEKIYEDDLRGVSGRRIIEVDANGNPVRELDSTPPVAGHDIYLSIDVRVQALAEMALVEALAAARERDPEDGNPRNAAPAGSMVVLDPNNGQVLAMASYPDYDPAMFVNGISTADFAALQDPAAHGPLNNRAIQGEYAPGSTFKLITATAALRTGMISGQDTILDNGEYVVPNCNNEEAAAGCVFSSGGAHGRVDLPTAIKVSSDVYFYDLGARLYFNGNEFGWAIQDTARDYGMGAETGVALPAEHGGFIPDEETQAARHEENPTAFPDGTYQAGDNVNLAIGQGDMLVTPLQLANAYATFANGGTVYSPNVALRVVEAGTAGPDETIVRNLDPRVLRQLEMPANVRDPILGGLIGVTKSGGTAWQPFLNFPQWNVAGKTGTAQVSGNRADTSLFVGFAPAEAPLYTVAAVLEESGFGAQAAAPLVRRMLEALQNPSLLFQLAPDGTLIPPPPPPQEDLAGTAHD